MLSDEALVCVGIIVEIIEVTGQIPTQIRAVLLVMLTKPTGDFIPIGLFPSMYRILGKCRRQYAVEWEKENERPYFAGSQGQSAIQTVWRQAANA